MRQLVTLTAAFLTTSFLGTGWSTAQAGIVAKQSMTSQADGKDGKAQQTQYTWSIDGDKFHLAVVNGGNTTQFVFNGRTLYACGKLNEAQMAGIGTDKTLLAPFREGACQVAPSNFMVRFFLSPQLAVESVDAFDGLKLTLAVKSYQVKTQAPAASKTAGRACQKFTRTYEINKSGGSADITATASEAFCQAGDIPWRAAIGKEVAKTVLRQPGGAALMGLLREDQKTLPGLVLDAEIRQTLKSKEGKRQDLVIYHLKTQSIVETVLPAERFKLPEGYRLFSPEGLDLAKLKRVKPAPGAADKEDSVLDMFQSAFFCAIAGRFGCFAN